MRLARSVVALAIVLATTTSYMTRTSYADDTAPTAVATQAVVTDTTTPNKTADAAISVTISAGDTLTAIAATHNTTVDAILALNAVADPNTIVPGQTLKIPGDSQGLVAFSSSLKAAAEAFMTPPAPKPAVHYAAVSTVPVVHASSAGNTYAPGYCTWYVKERVPSWPNRMGNAYQWLGGAQALGYATGNVPAAGAIGVERGQDHVVYVESTSADKSMVTISEMNYAGISGVHYRTVPAGTFAYIYV